MTQMHQDALRCLIAMQVAVLEHCDEQLQETKAIAALEKCNKEWQKIVKELGRM